MRQKIVPMSPRKRIALIAHDNKKQDMLEWAKYNKALLHQHDLFATGTTGSLIAEEVGLEITRFHSGPLGGDQQVGAAITAGAIDFLIFFLGSAGAASARPRRQGVAAHRCRVEHPRRVQPRDRRFYDFIAVDE